MDESRLSLLRAAQAGDDAAMDAMVRENAGLIWAVARRYFGRGVEPDDLFQLGSLGFLKAVRDFNRRSGEWYITIRDYSGGQPFTQDVRDRAITAMNLDIVNGNMPDLLSIQDGVPFKSWAEKGFLRDLGPWLAEEGVELLPQLRRAGTVDDKLLMVCASFTIRTAVGNRDVIGDPGGWTVAEASALAAASPDCAGVFPGEGRFGGGFCGWGVYSPEIAANLAWMRDELFPPLAAVLRAEGGFPMRELFAEARRMIDRRAQSWK